MQLDATHTSLLEFSVQLAKFLHRRRGMLTAERKAMRERLGGYYSAKGALAYGTLKHTLYEASVDEGFKTLAKQKGALWLEFGVFTATSTNITSKFIDVLASRDSVVPRRTLHGFDTFTGCEDA